uniref:Uncharacterized protein n=1 Tax=Panagrolaimus sp. JU765 TaxID=591449 RepID=A0AC34QQU7_9BILA
MNKLFIFVVFLGLQIAFASWDGPVETVEKEEVIDSPEVSHDHDDTIHSVHTNEIKKNRVDPILITTTKIPVTENSAILTFFVSFPLIFAAIVLL